MKYILETPIRGTLGPQKYETAIHWRNGILISDEPEKLGGKDLRPDPFKLSLSIIYQIKCICFLTSFKLVF